MKSGRLSMSDASVEANPFPESTGKLPSAIGYDIVLYMSFADHIFKEHSFQLCCINMLTKWDENCHFHQQINHYLEFFIPGGVQLK
jgi:hypothetical protein